MIKQHLKFELFGKLIIEKAVITPPMTVPGVFSDEACFIYAVQGTSRVYVPAQRISLNASNGVVMNCGNYLNEWLLHHR